MKFRTTLILLAALLVLGAVYVFHTASQPGVREYREGRERVFPPDEFQDPSAPMRRGLTDLATSLSLKSGASDIALQRGSGTKREWRLVKPVNGPADSGVVSSILNELEFLTPARTLLPGKDRPLDLKSYGLEPPARSIAIGLGGRTLTLAIGGKTEDGKSVYIARTDGPAVFVAPTSLLEKAAKGVADLRDRAALRFDRALVSRVELLPAGGPDIELSQSPAGWRMVRPVSDEAGADAVGRLLDAIAGLRIEAADFVAEDDPRAPEFGLDKPSLQAVLSAGESRRALIIGAAAKDRPGKVYARREAEPGVFLLSAGDAAALRKTAKDLRSHAAVRFSVPDVTAIAVTLPGKAVRVVKAADGWRMEAPADATADSEQVQLLLNDLRNLEVKDWIDEPSEARLSEAGLTPPRITVTLRAGTGANPVAIHFGASARAPEFSFARRGDLGPILVVPSDLVSRLETGVLAFVSRKVLGFNKEDLASLRITRPGGEVALERSSGKWMLTEPARTPADMVRLDDLLWTLSYLEARRLIAENPERLEPYGLDAPRIKAVLTLRAEDAKSSERRVLLVGKACDASSSYARMEDGRRVFTVGSQLVDLLTGDFARKGPAATTN